MDQDYVMQAMRSASGRGIAPVPGYGAGFVDGKGHTRVSFPPKMAQTPKQVASDILKDLSSRVIEL